MTKRAWGPVRRDADGKIEQVRAPTEDELLALNLELTRWTHAHPMPSKLWDGLQNMIRWQLLQYPWSRERIRRVRWTWVEMELRRGMKPKQAYGCAEKCLRGTPARPGPT